MVMVVVVVVLEETTYTRVMEREASAGLILKLILRTWSNLSKC